MNGTERESIKSPEHAEAQRNRIMDAAEHCFIASGFHAASMARIAETAEISQGLAYRYFKNKSAIILAIIERQLDERRSSIECLRSTEDFIKRIIGLFTNWVQGNSETINPVLLLEMTAEGSRDPEIANALARADDLYRQEFRKWVRRLGEDAGQTPSDESVGKRALAMQCFIEGMAVRAIRQPNLSPALLEDIVRTFIKRLMSGVD